MHPDDTIAALASAPGHAARGIIRISGPATVSVLESFFTPSGRTTEEISRPSTARTAWCYPGALQIDGLGRPLAVDLHLWPNRRSFTGQPLAELHVVSSPPILEAVLSDVFARGVRPAEPGEFTLRAFLAGRIDLAQAEAVLGVIDAGDDRELQTALDQLAGGLSSQIARLRGDLLDLLADLEAGLDFADEAIEFVSHAALVGRLGLARDDVAELFDRAGKRMRPSARPRVVLAGPPNAGKSTLFNVLAETSAALVSEAAGTTRDYLSADVTLGGMSLSLVDTAGSEQEAEGIGREAQKLGRKQIDEADLVVWCEPADESFASSSGDQGPASGERILPVATKSDLRDAGDNEGSRLAVSARSGEGLLELVSAIVDRLTRPAAGARQLLGTTAARSYDSLRGAQAALERALAIAQSESQHDLVALEVREALDELGKIAGLVYTDDILDRIFSRFCIGK
ncbi:MAG TPA: tRNA modification GTPase [Planctomycetaceae bacterium]|nr:tRNA modification GTPase [Planctomycetaceae bacterium]